VAHYWFSDCLLPYLCALTCLFALYEQFHKLWIDPHDIATVPKEILPHLELIDDQFGNQRFPLPILRHDVNDDRGDERERLRRRMLADSLQPRAPLEADAEDADPASELVPEDADKIAHMDIDDATVQEIQTFVLSGVSIPPICLEINS